MSTQPGYVKYQPVPQGPYDPPKSSNICQNCCIGWCIYFCLCCCCCLLTIGTLVGVGFYLFPGIPSVKNTGSKITSFQIVASPPTFSLKGEVYFQANSTAKYDINLIGATINVYYRTYSLGQVVDGNWGAIKAQSTSSLTLPISMTPQNPDVTMIALMLADKLTRGSIPITFNGTIQMNYIGIPFSYSFPTFTQSFSFV